MVRLTSKSVAARLPGSRKGLTALTAVLLLLSVSALPIAAQEEPAAPSPGVGGTFSAVAMVHTPDWPAATDVSPWDGQSQGTFTYRGIPCSGNAPVNNISSNLPTYNTQIPGSRTPASTRSHPMQFSFQDGVLSGRITWTVCNLVGGVTTDGGSDAEREKIFIDFVATPTRMTAEEVSYDGVIHVNGGTGRYADLTGEGLITGAWFCFDPQGCTANEGYYRDGQFVMHGVYFDPSGAQ